MSLKFLVNQAIYINRELEKELVALTNTKGRYITRLKRLKTPNVLVITETVSIIRSGSNHKDIGNIQKAKLILLEVDKLQKHKLENQLRSLKKTMKARYLVIEKLQKDIKSIKYQIKTRQMKTS